MRDAGCGMCEMETHPPSPSHPTSDIPRLTSRVHDAIRSPRAWVLLLSVTALGVATDLFSKWLAFAKIAGTPVRISREAVLEAAAHGRSLNSLIPPHDPITVVPHLLNLTLVLNPGAVFGIGAGHRW